MSKQLFTNVASYLQFLKSLLSSLQKKVVSGLSEENVTVIFLFFTTKFLVTLQGIPEINM